MTDTADTALIIYGLVDPLMRMIRYIGLSSVGMRRPKMHLKGQGTTHCARWIRKLKAAGHHCEIVVLDVAQSADGLPKLEQWWIAFGRACGWPLTNMTDGGDGAINPLPETRAKISSHMKERMGSPAARTKASLIAKTTVWAPDRREQTIQLLREAHSSAETRALLAENARRQFASPEVRRAVGERSLAWYAIPGNREKTGAMSKARQSTPAGRARQSTITKSRFTTEEQRLAHREKIKAGMARPEVRAKFSGDKNPAKRADVRAKMRESSRLRHEREMRERAEARQTKQTRLAEVGDA